MTVFLLVWINSNPGSATHQRGDLASASVSLSAVWEQPSRGINEVTHAEPLGVPVCALSMPEALATWVSDFDFQETDSGSELNRRTSRKTVFTGEIFILAMKIFKSLTSGNRGKIQYNLHLLIS